VKKHSLTNFRKDWNKFPEIYRGGGNFPGEISELTTVSTVHPAYISDAASDTSQSTTVSSSTTLRQGESILRHSIHCMDPLLSLGGRLTVLELSDTVLNCNFSVRFQNLTQLAEFVVYNQSEHVYARVCLCVNQGGPDGIRDM